MPLRQEVAALTNTVATLFGNIFAVMAKVEVMAAAKPTASTDLTMKHRVMNGAPAGTRSSSLQRNHRINKQNNIFQINSAFVGDCFWGPDQHMLDVLKS